MKLQIAPDHLRVRIDEAELAKLEAGATLRLAPVVAGCTLLDAVVRLGEGFAFTARAGVWSLRLDRARLDAYVVTLPRRESLSFDIVDGPRLDFAVDVRDSVRLRGARRRAGPRPITDAVDAVNLDADSRATRS